MVKFLIVGLPAFVVAVPLNFFLVEQLEIGKTVSYAFVMAVQVTVNFFMCRLFVFQPSRVKSIWRQFLEFTATIALFRVCDWALYSVLVKTTDINYIVIQCCNVVVFSFAKFFFGKKAIEGSQAK